MVSRAVLGVIAVVVAALVVGAGVLVYEVTRPPPAHEPGTRVPGSPVGPPQPSACATRGLNGTGGNWTTYHQDNVRSGDLPMASFAHATPRWTAPIGLDGSSFAEPLVCGGSIFVATENDSVYAVNATTGAIQWRTHLGTPVPGNQLPCGDIDPSGITGTPVIDVVSRTLYVVAFLDTPAPLHHVLFGLSLQNGSVRSQVAIDPPGSNVTAQQQRGALALANGLVYVPWGGLDGDCAEYHGWVDAVREDGSGGLISYQVPTHREGGIWTPGGIAVAPDGDLYVTTGNGDSTTTYDYGDSVLELSASLTLLTSFAPTNWAALNNADNDLGTEPPVLLPNGDVFQVGKSGEGYLLNGTNLGGIGGQIAEKPVCTSAYAATAHNGSTVFVACTDGVVAVRVGASNFTVAWKSGGFDAGAPIVTGDVVWAVDTSSSTLLGFNLTTGAQEFSLPLGTSEHFETPAAAPGLLVATGGNGLFAYDLD